MRRYSRERGLRPEEARGRGPRQLGRAALAAGAPMLAIGVVGGVVFMVLGQTDKLTLSAFNVIFATFMVVPCLYRRLNGGRERCDGA